MPIFRRENGQLAAVPGNYAILDQAGKLNPVMYDITKSLYVLSDRLIHSNDVEATTTIVDTAEILKTITLSTLYPNSIIRIKADVRGTSSILNEYMIYRNETQLIFQPISQNQPYITVSHDLYFEEGDNLIFKGVVDTNGIFYVRNLRLYGDKNIEFADPGSIFPEGLVGINI